MNYLPNAVDDTVGEEIISRMSRAIARRGPDDAQFYSDEHLSLVFRRLSIIDVDGGRQPIWNEDSSVMVVVNGEIYNHKELRETLSANHTFSTNSDSEVVLHLYEEYGERCFEHLNGMFAVALWDVKKKRLVLGRDRLGIKPLYYAETDAGIIFSSELKALMMHPECPSELNWFDVSELGLQRKERVSTYINGVEHLPGGAYLLASLDGKPRVSRYWSIDEHMDEPAKDENPASYTDAYSDLLDDAVIRQLMSDVPVGLFLSGGIDSSLIAAIAAKSNHNLHCFTVAERTTVETGDIQQAVSLCQELDVPLYAAYMDAADIVQRFSLKDLERMVLIIESPRFDPEWLFKYELSKFAKKQVPDLKVVLIGQGADEFAGGYSHVFGSDMPSWGDYLRENIHPSLVESAFANNGIPKRFNAYVEEEYVEHVLGGPVESYKTEMKLLSRQLQYFNLWHEDRTSSFNSVEARVPYLDHRLVELLVGVPESLHDELFWDKKIVREALEKHVPSYPKDKAKVPFFAINDASSVDELVYQIVHKIYPDFRERYLHTDETIFDWQLVNKLYDAVISKNGNFILKSWQIMEIMAISIFHGFCQHKDRILALVEDEDDVVIRGLSDDELQNVEQLQFSQPAHLMPAEWHMESTIRVPSGALLLTQLSERDDSHTIILIEDNELTQTLTIPAQDAWAVDMLSHLVSRNDAGDKVSGLASQFDQEPQKIVQVAEFLKTKGFVEQYVMH